MTPLSDCPEEEKPAQSLRPRQRPLSAPVIDQERCYAAQQAHGIAFELAHIAKRRRPGPARQSVALPERPKM
jgi:hypothetical protein